MSYKNFYNINGKDKGPVSCITQRIFQLLLLTLYLARNAFCMIWVIVTDKTKEINWYLSEQIVLRLSINRAIQWKWPYRQRLQSHISFQISLINVWDFHWRRSLCEDLIQLYSSYLRKRNDNVTTSMWVDVGFHWKRSFCNMNRYERSYGDVDEKNDKINCGRAPINMDSFFYRFMIYLKCINISTNKDEKQ